MDKPKWERMGSKWNSLALSSEEGDNFSPAKDQRRDALDQKNQKGIDPLVKRSKA